MLPVSASLVVAVACVSWAIAMDVVQLTTPDPNSVVRLPPVDARVPEPIDTPSPQPAAGGSQPIAELVGEIIVEEVVIEPEPRSWDASFEFGIDGSGGNTETFNFRFGADVELKVSQYEFEADFDYRKNTADWKETANRAFLDWQAKRLLGEPWAAFVHGTVEYDEFRDFDLRLAVDIGVSRDLIKTDTGTLSARFGGGFSRELGLPSEYYVPELVFGMDLEHSLSKRQKLTAKIDYMPDVTDFTDYRINTEAAWEVLIDQQRNLTLKTSILNRYDATPGTAKANDLDYSVVLLWSF
jgi:putative salt-induced outer membrane protein YdiY